MKKSLVLLSGLLSNNKLWQHQISHLSDIASIQILSSTEDTPKKMVAALLEKASPTFALAGHSMGGWLALEVMRTAPSRVSRLCLLNTSAREDSGEKKRRREAMIQRVQRGQFPDVVEEIVAHFVYNEAVKDAVRDMFLEVGPRTFINQEKAMMKRLECFSILPGITCPTLVIHALQDKNFSLEEHQELVHHIPGARLAQVEGSGHMSPLERPEDITALLREWLYEF